MEQGEAAIREAIRKAQDGWNAGSAEDFAAQFAEDADFVLVNGRHVKGREAIANGARADFSSIFKGSSNTYTVEAIRFIRPDVAIAHVHQLLIYNDGEITHEATARSTWVLTRHEDVWIITAFQNTAIAR
jgi:uncharacterized protein (TIGR02246 family)